VIAVWTGRGIAVSVTDRETRKAHGEDLAMTHDESALMQVDQGRTQRAKR